VMVPVIDRTGLQHVYRRIFGPFATDVPVEPALVSEQPVNQPNDPPTG